MKLMFAITTAETLMSRAQMTPRDGTRVPLIRAAIAQQHLEVGDGPWEPRNIEDPISDMITDLRHLADHYGLDWDHVLAIADANHETEAADATDAAGRATQPDRRVRSIWELLRVDERKRTRW